MSGGIRQQGREESRCCGAELMYLEQQPTPRGTLESVFECADCGNEVRIP